MSDREKQLREIEAALPHLLAISGILLVLLMTLEVVIWRL